ncbi:MAG: HK97 gp10 family phage protein [Candidatus Thiodiazotropha endolucinida]|nr:HK97 gp10 family phage protein [Candidatus Thiodiazotropha taylori]MCW4321599.1 HK97 gp10 family phage protein [Candidatus Thiodiazotropha taylori]
MASFSKQTETFTEKHLEKAARMRQAVILELFSSIVMLTPVDTGRARGNWIYSVGAPNRRTDSQPNDRSGSRVTGELNHLVSGDDGIYYFNNNLPYIGALEAGVSSQSPDGMVSISLNRVKEWIRKNEASLHK